MSEKKMTKTALDNELRSATLAKAMEMFSNAEEEVMQVSGTAFAFPTVDSEGNDSWIEISVKVPKGEKLGKGEGYAGYDGYEQAEFYKNTQTEKAEKAAAAKAAAEAKRKAKEEKKNKSKKKEEEGED